MLFFDKDKILFVNYITVLSIAIEYVAKTIDLIRIIQPKYFFIENPRDILRHLPVINKLSKYDLIRSTVSYYDYGSQFWKPTDLFHNNKQFKPKKMTQKENLINHTLCEKKHITKLLNAIPQDLCLSIIKSCSC